MIYLAKKKAIVTNAMRLLSAAKIPFEAITYEADEAMLHTNHFGSLIAENTGIPPESSFKTLVARGEKNGIFVCCIPVNCELDLKKLAKAAGEKKTELIPVKELLGLTGYTRGSVSPLGMKKKYPTYFHESCKGFDTVAISAGVCGCTLLLSPQELLHITQATACDLIQTIA